MTSVLGRRDAVITGLSVEEGGRGGREKSNQRGSNHIRYALTENALAKYATTVNQVVAGMN